ncbi:FecCD family ABC transporter permease [Amorphus sp. 3PC139-8]|uniref:FecCD family ABC transporter permease n=1 Tax=Amorphus sp. 3PC139-8 TaxID=2735676 RepID=UPI00345DF08D
MRGRGLVVLVAAVALSAAFLANLSLGASSIPAGKIVAALTQFDDTDYDHVVVAYQRLPPALIAIFVGAVMACGGCVLQGLTRNPLAAPSVLGVTAGATLFVVAGASVFGIGEAWQGLAAIGGGLFGFASTLVVARMAGLSRDPRGLALILSGAVVSMLYASIATALLLASPSRRSDFLGWVTGNINHVYAERLFDFWWIGAAGLILLMLLSRSLTLIALGPEKAASSGVNVRLVSPLALAAVVVSSSAAVAICGPIGFVGLVVPHIVRPFAGDAMTVALPANALLGASVVLAADIVARSAFAPYVVHTGVIMDLVGGLVFALIVKRFYLSSGPRRFA